MWVQACIFDKGKENELSIKDLGCQQYSTSLWYLANSTTVLSKVEKVFRKDKTIPSKLYICFQASHFKEKTNNQTKHLNTGFCLELQGKPQLPWWFAKG